MKLIKVLILGTITTSLLIGGYSFAVSNFDLKQVYSQLKSNFEQEQKTMKKDFKENPNDPQASERLRNLKQKASELNALAKEVDTDAYYKNKIESFIAALEGTINDETSILNSGQISENEARKLLEVVNEKKVFLNECKKIEIKNLKDPKGKYEDLKIKVKKITSKMEN